MEHNDALLTNAGLRYAVMLRAMPALRHDLSSPLSVMRMATMLLKRHLQREDMTPGQAVERVEQLEQQLGEISVHVRRLRQWDPQIRERQSLRALAQESIALARPMLMLHGIEVEPLPEDAQGWNDSVQAPQTLLYALLAAIYHLAEKPGAPPHQIMLEPSGPRSIRIRAHGQNPMPDVSKIDSAMPLKDTLPMNEAALARLAVMEHVSITVVERQVEIALAPEG